MIEIGHNSPLRAVGELCPFSLFGMIISIWFMISLLNNKHLYMLLLSEAMNVLSIWPRFFTPAACSGCLMSKVWHYLLNIKQSAELSFSIWLWPSFRNDGTKMPYFFKVGGRRFFFCRRRIFLLPKNFSKNLLQVLDKSQCMYYISSANVKNGFGFSCQAFWILVDMKISVAFFLTNKVRCFIFRAVQEKWLFFLSSPSFL